MSDNNTNNQNNVSSEAKQILVDFCNDIVLSRVKIGETTEWQARMGEIGAVAPTAAAALYDLAAVLSAHKILMDEGEDFDRVNFPCFFHPPLKSQDEVQGIIDSIAGPFRANAVRLVNDPSMTLDVKIMRVLEVVHQERIHREGSANKNE